QGCGAPPTQLLAHTVDSLKLLQSLSYFFPERALAAVQSLPLLAWQLPPSAFGPGAPASTMPLSGLPALCTDTQVLVGIMPLLRGFQQQCEAAQGSYPVTLALLDLAASFLERGYTKPCRSFLHSQPSVWPFCFVALACLQVGFSCMLCKCALPSFALGCKSPCVWISVSARYLSLGQQASMLLTSLKCQLISVCVVNYLLCGVCLT
ncbi:hypothetical protein DUNSADRAFT_1101, partial [Dunaliella salina]